MASGAFALGGQTSSVPKATSTGASDGRSVAVATTSKAKNKRKSKVKVGPRGPAGAKGENGAPGAPGAPGKEGATGKEGAAGKEGTAGKEGAAGKEGTAGKEGEPWTDGGTLPAGKTETGSWSIGFTTKEQEEKKVIVSLSFPIPLAGKESVTDEPVIGEANVHFFAEGQSARSGGGCGEGSATKPEAEPGNLCIFVGQESSGFNIQSSLKIHPPALREEGAGATGASLSIEVPSGGANDSATGTWAVTAPSAS